MIELSFKFNLIDVAGENCVDKAVNRRVGLLSNEFDRGNRMFPFRLAAA